MVMKPDNANFLVICISVLGFLALTVQKPQKTAPLFLRQGFITSPLINYAHIKEQTTRVKRF